MGILRSVRKEPFSVFPTRPSTPTAGKILLRPGSEYPHGTGRTAWSKLDVPQFLIPKNREVDFTFQCGSGSPTRTYYFAFFLPPQTPLPER